VIFAQIWLYKICISAVKKSEYGTVTQYWKFCSDLQSATMTECLCLLAWFHIHYSVSCCSSSPFYVDCLVVNVCTHLVTFACAWSDCSLQHCRSWSADAGLVHAVMAACSSLVMVSNFQAYLHSRKLTFRFLYSCTSSTVYIVCTAWSLKALS